MIYWKLWNNGIKKSPSKIFYPSNFAKIPNIPQKLSPQETDQVISESRNTSSILAVTYDYSIEANKNFTPPTLSITSFNFERCFTNAKIKATEKLSENITEEMTF